MNHLPPMLLLLLAGCSQQAQPVLSWDAYGPVRFGMSIEDAEGVAGARSNAERALDMGCDYTSFAALPGVRFMVENATIVRGDAEQGLANSLGISVGDTLQSVTTAHPEAVVTPHKYNPDGRYVLLKSAQGDRAIVLEIQNGKVSLIRAGLEPAVEYVESCG